MLEYAGISVFLFGNKRDQTSGAVIASNGMREEFELCVERGACTFDANIPGEVFDI